MTKRQKLIAAGGLGAGIAGGALAIQRKRSRQSQKIVSNLPLLTHNPLLKLDLSKPGPKEKIRWQGGRFHRTIFENTGPKGRNPSANKMLSDNEIKKTIRQVISKRIPKTGRFDMLKYLLFGAAIAAPATLLDVYLKNKQREKQRRK